MLSASLIISPITREPRPETPVHLAGFSQLRYTWVEGDGYQLDIAQVA